MDPNLYEAAVKGNVEPFKDIAKDGIKSLVTLTKNTILHINIIAQDEVSTTTKFVEEILEICPSLLLQNNAKGDTPLHVATKCGHAHIVTVLIERAKSQHDPDVLSGLGVARKMIRRTNNANNTALHEAISYGRLDIVKILMKEEPDFPYYANRYSETPLYMAAARRSSEMVAEILENCPSAAHQGPGGKTALHAVVIEGPPDMIKQIFEKKKSLIRVRDDYGWTPIHYAAFSGLEDIVKLFLEFDRSAAYIADLYRRTALHLAAAQGHADLVDLIISYSPEGYDLVDERGWNVLHFAMVSFRAQELKILLKNPFVRNLINDKDDNWNTPLHLLAAFCRDLSSDIVTYKSGGNYQAINRDMSVEHIIRDDSRRLRQQILVWSTDVCSSRQYPNGFIRITEQKWENQSEEIRSFSKKELDEYVIGIEEE